MKQAKNATYFILVALLIACTAGYDTLLELEELTLEELKALNTLGESSGGGGSGGGSCDPEVLAAKYAPQLRLHYLEWAKPSSVDWYLSRVDLIGGSTTALNISETTPTSAYLDIPSSTPNVKDGDINSTKCYVHIKQSDINNSDMDIQYWFFYPYNPGFTVGNVGAHEGDWEHITVRLNGTCGTIKKIHYAAHGSEGRWYYPGEFSYVNTTHPIVYSARGSHASYPTAGQQPRYLVPSNVGLYQIPVFWTAIWGITSGQDDDFTSTGGVSLDTHNILEFVKIEDFTSSISEPNWLGFQGWWGSTTEESGGSKGPWTSDGVPWEHEFEDYFLFYEGNNATQEMLGNLKGFTDPDPEDRDLDLQHMDSGWANDEIRSMRICNASAGTQILLFDNPDASISDTHGILKIKQNIVDRNFVINSFESSISNTFYEYTKFVSGQLDGKVSRIVIGDESIQEFRFYEGNNGSQNTVGTYFGETNWVSNLTNGGTWANDEIRSITIRNGVSGTTIKVWDSPGGSTGDDWTEIDILQDFSGPVTIGTFQQDVSSASTGGLYQVDFHPDNGLDGKISRIQVIVP